MHGDAHVLIDGRGDEEAAVLLIVGREVRASAAEGNAQWASADDHTGANHTGNGASGQERSGLILIYCCIGLNVVPGAGEYL